MKLRLGSATIAAAVLIAGVFAFHPGAFAATAGHTAFERTWNRTDLPVIEQRVNRTWMWGPQPFTGPMMEQTTNRPATGRQVQYFDKSRMELSTDPTINPYSIWYVTNGLLARELVTGMLQLGDNDFEPRSPAQVNVAGDWDDPTGPTYASFADHLAGDALDQGVPITQRIDRQGSVTDDPNLAGVGVTAAAYVPETDHTVASPFWSFMNSSGLVQEQGPPRSGALFPNPFYATGYPITEAFWANVKVGNLYTDVLIQVFERRVLTYTPGNPDGWQVEAGNVGRHYFEWRYGISPPEQVDGPDGAALPLGPTPLPNGQENQGGQISIVIANMSPEALAVEFVGPYGTPIEGDPVAPCPECQVLDTPPATCHPAAPTRTITLPAGSYAVTLNRQIAGNTLVQSGTWTFLPDRTYGACFFTVR